MLYATSSWFLSLKSYERPTHIDEAVQNVRDIFTMATKSLDQMSRSGAFHHLIRPKATVADTGLHEFNDLQNAALTASLSGEGAFGPAFENKDGQVKDKQLSDLMPEFGKTSYGKRNHPYPSESSSQKNARQYEDSYNKPYRSSKYSSGFRKPTRGGSYSWSYRNNFSKNSSALGFFHLQGDKSNISWLDNVQVSEDTSRRPLNVFSEWMATYNPGSVGSLNNKWRFETGILNKASI